MPIDTTWHDKDRWIVRHTFSDPWSVEDLEGAFWDVVALVPENPDNEMISYIVDLRETAQLPFGLLRQLPRFRGALDMSNGITVFVGGTTLMHILARTAVRLGIIRHMYPANSLPEAEQLIVQFQQQFASRP